MKLKNILLCVVCSIASLLALWGCAQNSSSSKTLVMGSSPDYPPFNTKKDGKTVGIDVDIANLICEKLGYRLEIKDLDFSGLIAALNTGHLDFVMSSMEATEERKKKVDFSDIYYKTSFAFLHKKDIPVDTLSVLEGKNIGVMLGSTMENFLKELIQQGYDFKILSLNRNTELVEELKLGRIDAVLTEPYQVIHYAEANPNLAYSVLDYKTGHGYAIAFPKGSHLKEPFNEALQELKESGKIQEIIDKWLQPSN